MPTQHQDTAFVAETVPGALFAFEVRPDGTWSFPYASPKLQAIAGLEPAMLRTDLGAAFARVHAADLPELLETIRGAVERRTAWEAVFRVQHPAKGWVWIEGRSEPAQGSGAGLLWHGFLFDATARRRSEQRRATEHSVARVLAAGRLPADVAPEVLRAICLSEGWGYGGLWALDDSGQRLRCLALWADAMCESSDLTPHSHRLALAMGEGLPGRVWATREPVHIPQIENDPTYLRTDAARAAGFRSAAAFPIHDGQTVIGVLDFLSRDSIEPTRELRETFGVVGGLLGQFIARTAAQEELQRFVALNPSVLYALRITPDKLRFFWVSENLKTMTGYSPTEAAHGNWWYDHLHPEDRDRVLAANPKPYTIEHQVLEFRFRHRSGHYLWLRDEKRLLRSSDGHPQTVIGSWSDITQRVQLEAQLRQAQKMEAIGILSGGIAHDFNNLLGAILGNVQMAAMDLAPSHPASEALGEIRRAGHRGAALVRQILAFARHERGRLQTVDLWGIAEESVRLMRASLPEGSTLSPHLTGPRPLVRADETQLHQVLLNLISNAIQALPNGCGSIRIDVDTIDLDAKAAPLHPDLQPGRHARLRVTDTGHGMDAATLERVFDPFFTTKPLGEGTGLGLSMVHGIIQAHHGTILAQSRPGIGTTFAVYLPLVEEIPSCAVATPAAAPLAQGKRILVIEDETVVARVVCRCLERSGHRTTRFASGEETFRALESDLKEFELVITDQNLPGMSGLEIAQRLQGLRPGLPILLCSGYVTETILEQAAACGILRVLEKPVSLKDLTAAVADAIGSAPNAAFTSSDPSK